MTVPGDTVLLVGDVINDVVVRPHQPVSRGSDTLSTVACGPGGSGANQAAWLGALGARVRFAGRVGAADAAEHAVALRQHGVETHLAVDPQAPTGTIVVLVGPDGDRDMYTDRGANLTLTAGDLGDELLDGVGLLHLSGYSLFDPGLRHAVLAVAARARAHGAGLSIDPVSAAFLGDLGPGEFCAWTQGAVLAFPNLDEGRMLTGAVAPDDVVDALLATYPAVALKLGPDGAVVATRAGERIYGPALPGEVVDTTGGGDAFCAGFLSAWVAGCDLARCTQTALAAAGRAVARLGARPAHPVRPPC